MVLQPNFRGSTNYGQAFVNANINSWGIADYQDVMTGVDFAIAEGWADPERLIYAGWSYGGYLECLDRYADRPLQGGVARGSAHQPRQHVQYE